MRGNGLRALTKSQLLLVAEHATRKQWVAEHEAKVRRAVFVGVAVVSFTAGWVVAGWL